MSELIQAILSGAPLEYTPERHSALVDWAFFSEPPAGHEQLREPFGVLAQLDAWQDQQIEYERERRQGRRG